MVEWRSRSLVPHLGNVLVKLLGRLVGSQLLTVGPLVCPSSLSQATSIIAGVVGAALALVLLFLIIVCINRRKQQERKHTMRRLLQETEVWVVTP